MADISQLRALYETDSDEAAILAASKEFGMSPSAIAREVGYKVGGQWGNRASASIDSYQAGLYGIPEAMGSEWARKRRIANDASAELQRNIAREQGAISSYKDVGGVGDALNYVGGLAVDSAPYLGEALLGGGLGGLAARGAAGAGARAAARTGGAVAVSYPSSVGDVLSNQREQANTTDLGAAAALGVPYAALNAFGLEGAAARVRPFRIATDLLDNTNGVRGGLARAGVTAGQAALQEGVSEVGQEFINQAGRNVVDPNAGYFGPEAMNRYGEAFVGGAALGGVVGASMGGWRRSESYQPVNLMDREPDAPQGPPQALGWNGYFNPQQGQNPFVVFPDGSTATQSDVELQQRYGMTPDTLAGIRAGVPRIDPAMAAEDSVSPYLPGKIIADEGGVAALDARDANSLYGQENGDPGLIEARRRYLESRRQQEETKRKFQEVAGERLAARKEAVDVLIDKDEAGRPMIALPPKAFEAYYDLRRAKQAGSIGEAQFVDAVGRLKEALYSNDKATISAVAKEAKAVVVEKPKGAPDGLNQPVVRTPAAVAAGPVGQQGVIPGGSVGDVRPVPAVTGAGPIAGNAGAAVRSEPAPAPGGSVPAPAVVANAAPGLDAAPVALTKKPTTGAKPLVKAGATAVMGGQVDFKLLNDAVPDPRLLKAIRLHLGVDAEGNRIAKPLSQAKAAAEAGMGDNSHDRVSKAMKALGITPDVKQRFQAGDATADAQTNLPEDEPVVAEDNSPVLSDEAVDTEDRTTLEDQGITAISGPGGTKSNTDAPKVGLARKGWFPKNPGEELPKMGMEKFAELVHRAVSYDTPADRQALTLVLNEAKARAKAQPAAFHAAFQAAERKGSRNEGEVSTDNKPSVREAAVNDEEADRTDDGRGTADETRASESAEEGAAASEQPKPKPVVTIKKRRTILRSSASATGDDVIASSAENRTTLLSLANQHPHVETAIKFLRAAGLGKAADYVYSWHTVDSTDPYLAMGWLEDTGGQYAITLRPEFYRSEAETVLTVNHEIGHAVDQVTHGGVYSSRPEMQYGKGSVFVELYNLWRKQDSPIGEMLNYPLSGEEQINDPYVIQAEVFAQLFAFYTHPKLRAMLGVIAPNASAFMKKVVSDVEAKEPHKYHNRIWTAAEAAQFDKTQPYLAQRVSGDGASAAAEGTAGSDRGVAYASGGRFADPQKLIDAHNANKATDSLREKIAGSLSPKAQDGFTSVRDWFKKHAPQFLTNYQLKDQYGKKLTALADYVGHQQLMAVKRNTLMQSVHNLAVDWDGWAKNNKAEHKQLMALMQRATMKQIHPDLPFDHADNKHLGPGMKAEYDALAAQYKALSNRGRTIYQEVKKSLADQWAERQASYNELVNYTYDRMIEKAQDAGNAERADSLTAEKADAIAEYGKKLAEIKGPYFPLVRFGQYLVIGESEELKALRAKVDAATGEERRKLDKQLESMEKDEKHYVVSAHETAGKANAAVREYTAKGLAARRSMTDQSVDGLRVLSQETMGHINDLVDAQFDKNVAADLKSSINQIFLRSLPEMHALRREAERKGIEGASADMLRAFAAVGQQNSFYTSRLQYASKMADAMLRLKEQAKGDYDMHHIHREMEKRMALDMQYKATPIQDAISSVSWAYHLGVSPSFMFINSSQPWLVTAPLLAGRHGLAASGGALKSAYADAIKILRDARYKDGKWDWWSGISENSLAVRDERKALRELMQRGIVDEGLSHDLNMYADDQNRALAKVNRVMGWTTQQIELLNRTTSALAAFRLEMKRTGNYQKALDYAYETTLNSQFDYSQEGTARFMREGGGVPMAKLIFQFRRYQQGMLYTLLDNLKKSGLSTEEKREHTKILGYFILSSGLSAGALGLPFIGSAMWAINLALDDDDPRGNAEVRLRNLLADITGDKALADTLAKGIPAMFGADVSQRIGLGDIASPFPMSRFDQARTGTDTVKEAIFQALGPSGGMAARMLDGLTMFGEGEWGKGSEKLLPKAGADVLRGVRYGTEGMTERGGAPTGTDLDAKDVVLRTLGIAPTAETNYYEGTNAIKNIESATKDRLSVVGKAFQRGLRSGDMQDARRRIDEYNNDHPEAPITPKQEMEWRRQVLRESKNRDEGSGIKLGTKKNAAYNEVARFAQ